MTELVGTVDVRLVGAGSKSEMSAVVLVSDDPAAAPVVLRRRDAAALDAEEELAAYLGRRVRVVGEQAWSSMVVDSVEVLDEAAPPSV